MADKENIDFDARIAKIDKRRDVRAERTSKWREKIDQADADDALDKLRRQNLVLQKQMQMDKEKVAQASVIVGIAQAARDVFGQDLPTNREEARAAMQRVMAQAQNNQNQNK